MNKYIANMGENDATKVTLELFHVASHPEQHGVNFVVMFSEFWIEYGDFLITRIGFNGL